MSKDKEYVESLEIGQFSVAFSDVTIYWVNEDNRRLLSDKLIEIRDNLFNSKKAIGALICRHAVVTNNFNDIVYQWQDLLDEPRLVSTDKNSEAVGKSFTWGDGQPETTFSVIIISEIIAYSLINENLKDWASSIIAHEYAHCHDNLLQLNCFGQSKLPFSNDWLGLRRANALSMWSEYFAETVAVEYLDLTQLDSHLELLITMIKASIETLTKAVAEYGQTDVGKLWGIIQSELSKLANQFGRVFGLVVGFEKKDLGLKPATKLFDKISDSSNWKKISEKIYEELQNFEKADWKLSDSCNGLDTCIELLLNTMNIYIQINNTELILDTRYYTSRL